jgi:8-oxo-dGTP pyrophosphatase MutT (NUDIX family)
MGERIGFRSASHPFIGGVTKLTPADAVAALLVLEDGRYVMQLRDPLPSIFYPDHWGCFGGALDAGESASDALIRELEEELEFVPRDFCEFTRFDFDFSNLGQGKIFRIYYEVQVPMTAFDRFVLHEGAEFEAFEGGDLLIRHRVTPYDAFAVWAHLNKSRFNHGCHSIL